MNEPADRIELVGLRGRGHHGVFAHERRDGQEFVVDVVIGLDTRTAAAGDDLSMTVDYGTLAQDVVAVIEGPPVDLIETLAQRIADGCLTHRLVAWVQVRVHKPQAPVPVPFTDLIVSIRRTRDDAPPAPGTATDQDLL